ncbi:hypothetical protein DSO57_1027277 [Entomophthora muscae]|uniref:Uncharacterized protein n=1 Tax=Entomophthora muscae TaxID=34485 RepID=A0ACC2TD49_9FUNG|nr:hypothetical protein DSO57_1027277 [Entomophthora muscae]
MAGLREEVKALWAAMAFSGVTPPPVKEEFCCSGSKGPLKLIYKICANSPGARMIGSLPLLFKCKNDNLWVATANRESGFQQATTLTTLDEDLRQLWALQAPVKSEAEFTSKIYVLNSNYQDSSNGSANTDVDPNYKPSFEQVFYPKTLTSAA